MKVHLNEITGIADAIVSMFISKRTWTRELEGDIRDVCACVVMSNGSVYTKNKVPHDEKLTKFNKWMDTLCKWGTKHITMLRYIDFSFTVEGLHRGGQDDWDSHAMRFNNRIIRSSTRLASFGHEMSDWYKGKIIPTDQAIDLLKIPIPKFIEHEGNTYRKGINGYILDTEYDNPDVKRGLYMLSIPSNFIFKVNLTEFSHVYKERNIQSSANPEVKIMCEMMADELQTYQPHFTRELFIKINN